MQISLESTGGFAGAAQRPRRVVSSEALAANERAELLRLVQALQSAPGTPAPDAGRFRDSMLFTISIDDAGVTREYQAHDFAMPPAFSDLMQWLQNHAS